MPACLRDLKRALVKLGCANRGAELGVPLEDPPWPGVLYDSLKTEITNQYISGACRALGIDKGELKKAL
jgi:hypothetical protein